MQQGAAKVSHLPSTMMPVLLLCLLFSLHQATAQQQHHHHHHHHHHHEHYEIPGHCRSVECPEYMVVARDTVKDFEIRKYDDPLWVTVRQPERASSIEKGFFKQAPILTSFFEGNNNQNQTIPRTAPALTIVLTNVYQPNQEVSTAVGDPLYLVAFYLPHKNQSAAPESDAVRFGRFPPANRYVAVKRFGGGSIDNQSVARALAGLRASLKGTAWENPMKTFGGDFAVADYNYPDVNGVSDNEILLPLVDDNIGL